MQVGLRLQPLHMRDLKIAAKGPFRIAVGPHEDRKAFTLQTDRRTRRCLQGGLAPIEGPLSGRYRAGVSTNSPIRRMDREAHRIQWLAAGRNSIVVKMALKLAFTKLL
jgi:hypothetical protein